MNNGFFHLYSSQLHNCSEQIFCTMKWQQGRMSFKLPQRSWKTFYRKWGISQYGWNGLMSAYIWYLFLFLPIFQKIFLMILLWVWKENQARNTIVIFKRLSGLPTWNGALLHFCTRYTLQRDGVLSNNCCLNLWSKRKKLSLINVCFWLSNATEQDMKREKILVLC